MVGRTWHYFSKKDRMDYMLPSLKKKKKGQSCEPDLAGTRLSSPESIGLGI